MTTDGKEPEVGEGVSHEPTPPNTTDTAAGPDTTAQVHNSDPIGDLRERITAAAEGFMKARLGLEEGADGSLQLPNRGVFENVGQQADQFLRGFLKGVVEKTPEEREAAAGLRDKADVPSATEVVGRLLSKASGAVSTSFQQYLKTHVAAPDDKSQVVVDGRFLLQHGAPLLAGFVQALGRQFAEKGPEDSDTPAPEPVADAGPKVDYKVDLPSLFTSLFVRPKNDDGGSA
jgi:hypothetical protein